MRDDILPFATLQVSERGTQVEENSKSAKIQTRKLSYYFSK